MTAANRPPQPAGRPVSHPPRGPELPELDLRVWYDPSSRPRFAEQLRDIAHRSGLCYLTGHGVTQQRSTDLLGLARRFFALPEKQRFAVENIKSPHFRGYTPAGRELTGGRMDWRELFDIGRERPALPLGPDDPPWQRLTGPNQWPAELPELRPALLELLEDLQGIGSTLLSALAIGLGMHEDLFTVWFDDQAHARLKLLHYPSRPQPEHEQGAGTHKDYGFLSMVIQDSQGGLQIADEQGGWRDVTPRPGRLVVNLGEMLELATNGYLLATAHRVLSPPAGADRTSIAFFLNPRLDAEISPVPLPARLAAEARGSTQDPANPVFTTYGRNEFKGWVRAHPRVARRHYPDLDLPPTPPRKD